MAESMVRQAQVYHVPEALRRKAESKAVQAFRAGHRCLGKVVWSEQRLNGWSVLVEQFITR